MFHRDGSRRETAIRVAKHFDEESREFYSKALFSAEREHSSRVAKERTFVLRAAESNQRLAALEVIAAFAEVDATYVAGIAACLSDADASVRYLAAVAIAKAGEAVLPYADAVEKCVNDPDPGVLLMVERAVAKLQLRD